MTGDDQLESISASLDQAFKDAFVHYRDVNNSVQHLEHYTLSVCLMHQYYYTVDYKTKAPELGALNNFYEGYENHTSAVLSFCHPAILPNAIFM